MDGIRLPVLNGYHEGTDADQAVSGRSQSDPLHPPSVHRPVNYIKSAPALPGRMVMRSSEGGIKAAVGLSPEALLEPSRDPFSTARASASMAGCQYTEAQAINPVLTLPADVQSEQALATRGRTFLPTHSVVRPSRDPPSVGRAPLVVPAGVYTKVRR